MKLRNLINLPVFYEPTARVIGKVIKVVIGDDYRISYLVVDAPGKGIKMIRSDDFMLADNSVIIKDLDGMKSYMYGEELSVYEQKLGDVVYDREGREIGSISDFVISCREKTVSGLEVYAGFIGDLLYGREVIPLQEINWKSIETAVVKKEGSDTL